MSYIGRPKKKVVSQASFFRGYFSFRLGGGFKYCLFSPLFGEGSHFDSYFLDGLKPPTSEVPAISFLGRNNTSRFFNEAPMCVLFIQRKHAFLCVCVVFLRKGQQNSFQRVASLQQFHY